MTSSLPPDLVRSATAGGVTTLTLDSPPNRNALSHALIDQLLAALAAAGADPATRVVVLDHTGPVFCSGADLKETREAFETGAVPVARLGDLLAAVWHCPKPVVARVGGPARAGGVGLIAAADLAFCTGSATFAFSEVRLGVVPAVISAVVRRRITPRAAAELFLTGEAFDGHRAEAIGLVTSAVPEDALDATVASAVAAILKGAPGALAAAKALSRGADVSDFGATLRDELAGLTELSVRYFTSPEGREGISSFVEKRPPSWTTDG